MWTNPTQPNLSDFAVFVANQGVPGVDLPSGTIGNVNISTTGAITSSGSSGTVAAGMVLYSAGFVSNTYLVTWSGTAGTVYPVPAAAISVPPTDIVQVLSPYLQWAFNVAMDQTLIPPPCMPPLEYVLAVYNLGMHQLLKIAQDQTGLTISSLSWANGLVTATTSAPLNMSTGSQLSVQVVGAAPVAYNGAFTATVTGSNTFTYPMPTSPGTNTAPGMYNLSFFSGLRSQFNLMGFTAGPIISSNDNGTGDTLLAPDFLKGLTMSGLDLLKTPYGREYLAYSQQYGSNIVGVS
jgi:hypothetical protein